MTTENHAPMTGSDAVATVKVTVLVATYRPGERIERVVNSLDKQSMPATDFEVIFVDDGSPDDTVEQLERIAATRPNTRVISIEHSGWPSRPRNVGIEAARGEYVLFMDHDDEIAVDALARGYKLAHVQGVDVLNGKEARTDQPSWAIDMYRENLPAHVDRPDEHPLIPTNPHKLYRRQFLIDGGIRFPEGGQQIWEDVFFNVDVAAKRPRVAVLADVPFYHWVRKGETLSSSYLGDPLSWWRTLREIFDHTEQALNTPDLEYQRTQLHHYQLRTRALQGLGARLMDVAADELPEVLEIAGSIVNDYADEAVFNDFPRHLAARARLLQLAEPDLLVELASMEQQLVPHPMATQTRWVDGKLNVHFRTTWVTGDGAPPALRRVDDRVERVLSPALAEALGPEYLDVTDDLRAATTRVGLRGRESFQTWLVKTTSTVHICDFRSDTIAVVEGEAYVDLATAQAGAPLDSQTWDFNANNTLFATTGHRKLRTDLKGAQCHLARHRVAVVYRANDGTLSLDLDQHTRNFLVSSGFESAPISQKRSGLRSREFVVPLAATASPHAEIPVDISGSAVRKGTAVLTEEDGQAQVRGRFLPTDDGTVIRAELGEKSAEIRRA